MAFNWVCPHCDRAQSVNDDRVQRSHTHIYIPTAEGNVGVNHLAIACSNPTCKKLTLEVSVLKDRQIKYGGATRWEPVDVVMFRERVLPRSSATPQPDYIPVALREDYLEACLIVNASPKAAATLARRCLQGMIRDFAGITKATLYQEIAILREAVDGGKAPQGITIESIDAIDHVRGVGNIGAHMEGDIDVIIPVESGEARMLIELVEMLFRERYVERHQRAGRLSRLAALAAEKSS